MKKMTKVMLTMLASLALAALVGSVTAARAAELIPLTADEAANAGGANFVFSFNNTDLTTTNQGLPQALAIAVKSNSYVECKSFVLVKAFDNGATTGSVQVCVGDSSVTNRYLASTQVASDDTEVWYAPGRGPEYVATVVTNTAPATNGSLVYVTSVAIVSNSGWRVYGADDNVNVYVWPESTGSVSALTCGAARVYLKIQNAAKLR